MFRFFGMTFFTLVAVLLVLAVLKVVAIVMFLVASVVIGIPLIALWLWMDPASRRNWRGWKEREEREAFRAWGRPSR